MVCFSDGSPKFAFHPDIIHAGQDEIQGLSADGYDAVADDDCGDVIDKLRAAFGNENDHDTDSGDENAGIADETPHTPQDYTNYFIEICFKHGPAKIKNHEISGNLKSILGHVCPPQESGSAPHTTKMQTEQAHPEKTPSEVPTPVLWPYFNSLVDEYLIKEHRCSWMNVWLIESLLLRYANLRYNELCFA